MSAGNNSFDAAFAYIERSRSFEAQKQWDQASALLREALRILTLLVAREADPSKQRLLRDNIAALGQHQTWLGLLTAADRTFAAALDDDEKSGAARDKSSAINKYVTAADDYIKALRVEEGQGGWLRARVTMILDRVADLKGKTAAAAAAEGPAPAPPAPTRQPGSVPLLAPVAPPVAPAAKYAPAPPRAAAVLPSASAAARVDAAAAALSSLTPSEISVLRNSSRINGRLFLPWLEGDETRERFRFDGRQFTDPDGVLPLSAEQRSLGAVWKRPSELMGLVLKSKAPSKGAGGAKAAEAATIAAAGSSAEEEDAGEAGAGGLEDELEAPAATEPATVHPTASSAPASTAVPGLIKPIIMVRKVDPLAVTQDLVSDCSFVCSLCIAASFELNFKKQLITKIIFPQNASGMPIYNAYGKYLVKLFLNGTFRKVVVDDFLPVDGANRLLCSSGQVSASSMELWVSIIEKAYMKVNGGYDFPGSNSGIDLFALTGWIPEQVFFAEDSNSSSSSGKADGGDAAKRAPMLDHRQSEDRAWERMKSALSYGDCLVTISTGPAVTEAAAAAPSTGSSGRRRHGLTPSDEAATGLVPGHAYAVLDVQEVGTLRMLKVKNPWAKKPWKGRFSSEDAGSWTPALRAALGVTNSAEFYAMAAKGVFWMEFADCRKYFRSFFLNWNPSLFKYRFSTHALWPVAQGPANDTYYVGDNPQYTLSVHNPTAASSSAVLSGRDVVMARNRTVWVLVSRHITDSRAEAAAATREEEGGGTPEICLTVHVFKSNGERIYGSPAVPLVKGAYSSDPHYLARFDVEGAAAGSTDEEWSRYTLVLSQLDKRADVSYSLSVYATAAFRLAPTPALPPRQVELLSEWSAALGTNGGSPSSPNFARNPQFRVDIRPAAAGGGSIGGGGVGASGQGGCFLHIQAKFPKEIFGNILLVRGRAGAEAGARVQAVYSGDDALSSGDYRPGFCFTEGYVAPGAYTLIVSAFDASMQGASLVVLAAEASTYLVATQLP